MKRDRIIGLINNLAVRRVSRKISILLFIILFVSLGNVNTLKLGAEEVKEVEIGGKNYDLVPNQNGMYEIVLSEEEYEKGPYPNSTLYAKVPASESRYGVDTCIYLTNYRSQEYLSAVNEERASWGVAPASYSQDLEEGAMLRAGEATEAYVRNQELGPHETYRYPTAAWENTIGNYWEYDPLFPMWYWQSEKKHLPTDYTPQKYGYIAEYNGSTVGHYATLNAPQIQYLGQGYAYDNPGCDGGVTLGYGTFTDEHYTDSTDLYPDFDYAVSQNLNGEYAPMSSANVASTSNATTSNASSDSNEIIYSETNTDSNTNTNTEEEKKEQAKIKEEKKLKEQQEKEFQAKQKENDARREKEALLNDKTHKHRDDESLTTAGKNHFMAMMMWALVISVVYFIGSKVLYLRNK